MTWTKQPKLESGAAPILIPAHENTLACRSRSPSLRVGRHHALGIDSKIAFAIAVLQVLMAAPACVPIKELLA